MIDCADCAAPNSSRLSATASRRSALRQSIGHLAGHQAHRHRQRRHDRRSVLDSTLPPRRQPVRSGMRHGPQRHSSAAVVVMLSGHGRQHRARPAQRGALQLRCHGQQVTLSSAAPARRNILRQRHMAGRHSRLRRSGSQRLHSSTRIPGRHSPHDHVHGRRLRSRPLGHDHEPHAPR